MIVPSMTPQEVHDEFFYDIRSIDTKLNIHKKDFGRKVLKASYHPFTYSYDCFTRKKNLIVVTFTVLKRSQWEKPMLGFYGVYNRPDGKYAAALSLETGNTSIYPPHFFKRYRERLVKDELLSNDAIIRRYFRNEWGLIQAVVDENFEAVYHCFENINKDDKVSFVSASSEGYCFGERQGNINIVKTIISEEMLFDNQKALFDKLRREFDDANKERYK